MRADGAARARRAAHRAWRGGDAGLHAGRHRRHGQGHDRRRGAGHGRAHRARQHLSPDAAARRRTGRRGSAACTVHGLARADPDRFRRLPGDVAGRAAEDGRGRRHLPIASRRQQASPDAGAQRSRSSTCWMPTSPCASTNARPSRRPRSRRRPRCGCRCAGRSAAATPSSPREGYGLFGIVQGSIYPDLRAEIGARADRRSASTAMRSAGLRSAKARRRCSACSTATMPLLPADAPRYLMGVGTPDDIVGAVRRGIDMFDCVIPTRVGPHRPRLYQRAACSTCATRAIADDAAAARPGLRLPGLHAAFAAPICTTCSRRRRCSARCC